MDKADGRATQITGAVRSAAVRQADGKCMGRYPIRLMGKVQDTRDVGEIGCAPRIFCWKIGAGSRSP